VDDAVFAEGTGVTGGKMAASQKDEDLECLLLFSWYFIKKILAPVVSAAIFANWVMSWTVAVPAWVMRCPKL